MGSGDTGKRQILSKGVLGDLWIWGDSVEQCEGWDWKLTEGLNFVLTLKPQPGQASSILCLPLPERVAEKPAATGRGLLPTVASSCFSAPCQGVLGSLDTGQRAEE